MQGGLFLINKSLSTALYIQIANDIEQEIRGGVLKSNEKLPSERELGDRYKVSRITIRQAIGILERNGLIYSVQGKGTYVRPTKIQQNLMRITSFAQTLQEKGLQGSTTVLSFEINPSKCVPLRMQNIQNAPASYSLKILGLGDGVPMVFYLSYFREDIGNQMCSMALDMSRKGMSFSTFDLYKLIAKPIGRIEQEIFAENIGQKVSAFLKIKHGDSVLRLESVIYDQDDEIMECKIGYYRADMYSFKLIRPM